MIHLTVWVWLILCIILYTQGRWVHIKGKVKDLCLRQKKNMVFNLIETIPYVRKYDIFMQVSFPFHSFFFWRNIQRKETGEWVGRKHSIRLWYQTNIILSKSCLKCLSFSWYVYFQIFLFVQWTHLSENRIWNSKKVKD